MRLLDNILRRLGQGLVRWGGALLARTGHHAAGHTDHTRLALALWTERVAEVPPDAWEHFDAGSAKAQPKPYLLTPDAWLGHANAPRPRVPPARFATPGPLAPDSTAPSWDDAHKPGFELASHSPHWIVRHARQLARRIAGVVPQKAVRAAKAAPARADAPQQVQAWFSRLSNRGQPRERGPVSGEDCVADVPRRVPIPPAEHRFEPWRPPNPSRRQFEAGQGKVRVPGREQGPKAVEATLGSGDSMASPRSTHTAVPPALHARQEVPDDIAWRAEAWSERTVAQWPTATSPIAPRSAEPWPDDASRLPSSAPHASFPGADSRWPELPPWPAGVTGTGEPVTSAAHLRLQRLELEHAALADPEG